MPLPETEPVLQSKAELTVSVPVPLMVPDDSRRVPAPLIALLPVVVSAAPDMSSVPAPTLADSPSFSVKVPLSRRRLPLPVLDSAAPLIELPAVLPTMDSTPLPAEMLPRRSK